MTRPTSTRRHRISHAFVSVLATSLLFGTVGGAASAFAIAAPFRLVATSSSDPVPATSCASPLAAHDPVAVRDDHEVATAAVTSRTSTLGFHPNLDLVPSDMVLSAYGNAGPGALGDCVEAAAATYEQIVTDRSRPLPRGPWVSTYDALATSAGEQPGADAGTSPLALFGVWEESGIAGTKISSVEAIATGEAALRRALRGGPVFLTLRLPAPSAKSLPWTTDPSGYVTTPWTSPDETPGYGGSGPTLHAALLVGFGTAYAYVATWGAVLPIGWPLFEHMITNAWEIIG